MRKEIIYLQGGLGNQMFQYAFYLSKKEKGRNVTCDASILSLCFGHNGYELDEVFGLKVQKSKLQCTILRLLNKLMNLSVNRFFPRFLLKVFKVFGFFLIKDNSPTIYLPYIDTFTPRLGLTFYLGYWQTEKYFIGINDLLMQTFVFNEVAISIQNRIILEKIEEVDSVSLHIRRGDYLLPENRELFGGICTLDYYRRAIDYILDKVKNPFFFIFSNDIVWVKENMNISNSLFITWNSGKDSWQDMFLMSKCKHNVIANSTFSWWGAWLNKNPQKIVISPSRFFNVSNNSDIVPDTWTSIQV